MSSQYASNIDVDYTELTTTIRFKNRKDMDYFLSHVFEVDR